MGRERILDYALIELDRLNTANEQVAALLPRMRHAAHDVLLERSLDERLSISMDVRAELGMVYGDLVREYTETHDPLVLQFCRQADEAIVIADPALRDLHLAQALVALDHWLHAVCTGLVTLFRQLHQDPAADGLYRAAYALRQGTERIEQLWPSLTGLHHDEERHGHQTRSPEERLPPNQLASLVLAGTRRR